RHGKVVFEGDTKDYSSSDIAALMTGHEVEVTTNVEETSVGETFLSIDNLVVKSDRGFNALEDFSLQIKSGEIVGLAGVSGNGQRELAEVLNGLRKVESGKIIFNGTEIQNKTPREVISLGMGYIPEERNTEGIVPSMSIRENFILKDTEDPLFSSHHILKDKEITSYATKAKENFDIRAASLNIAAGSLSGGNIQKVILAREIGRNPKFLVCVYPIRGLDMGAAEFIHKELLALRNKGIGILLISEELEEIMNMSDRIAVIFKGHVQKILNKNEATTKKLGVLMAGVKE
ncbi:MAG: ATP-binding cassette domain-containing protein, partial [Sphaerochaetaceae bacterium]|nr:ATP-binding cassette domain-containing protein [Sphaerochaetaceae bacterium]